MTSCPRMCVYIWEQPYGHQNFILFNRKNKVEQLGLRKYAQYTKRIKAQILSTAHNTQQSFCFLSFFLFLSLLFIFYGGNTSYTHSENKNAKPSHKMYCTRVRKSENERKREIESGQSRSIRGMACRFVDFFPYSWYWYCAHTIIVNWVYCVFVYAWCVHCVCCAVLFCNVFAVWPCCGLFCLAFLFSCVSCCRSAEMDLYIGLKNAQFNGKNIPRSIQFVRSLSSTKFSRKRFSTERSLKPFDKHFHLDRSIKTIEICLAF